MKQKENEETSTHQLKVLNATYKVGSVGPSTLDIHTIWKREKKDVRDESNALKDDIHTSHGVFMFSVQGCEEMRVGNMLVCVTSAEKTFFFLPS